MNATAASEVDSAMETQAKLALRGQALEGAVANMQVVLCRMPCLSFGGTCKCHDAFPMHACADHQEPEGRQHILFYLFKCSALQNKIDSPLCIAILGCSVNLGWTLGPRPRLFLSCFGQPQPCYLLVKANFYRSAHTTVLHLQPSLSAMAALLGPLQVRLCSQWIMNRHHCRWRADGE